MPLIKKRVIVDTGYMVGCFHDRDPHHQQVMQWESEFGDNYELITTHAVTQEIYQLLLTRVGCYTAVEFLKCVSEEWIQVLNLPIGWQRVCCITPFNAAA